MGFSATRSRLAADSYIVSFDGALDLHAAERLKQVLFDVIAAGATDVTLDLCAATSVDSTAAGVLIIAENAIRRKGGSLRVGRLPAGLEGGEVIGIGHLLELSTAGVNGG